MRNLSFAEKVDLVITQLCFLPLALQSKRLGQPVNLTDEAYEVHLKQLKATTISTAEFYLVVNLKHQRFDFVYGLDKVLGYSNVTFRAFLELVHPSYLYTYLTYGLFTYQLANNLRRHIVPLKQTHQVAVPLKRHDGSYGWYLQSSTAIRCDKDNNMVCHLNKYTYIGRFNSYSLRPFEAYFTNFNTPKEEWDQYLLNLIRHHIQKCFNYSELELMRLYVKGHDVPTIVTKKLSRLTQSTILSYNKKMKKKGTIIFRYHFPTAADLAIYCSDRQLLESPEEKTMSLPWISHYLRLRLKYDLLFNS